MTDPVEFKNISLRRGETALFDGLDLTLPGGQTSALLGESGAGKSSLLELINGLLTPTNGAVHVFGQSVADADLVALRRRIGYAVQGTGLFPHLDISDNIGLVAQLEGWQGTRVTDRISELMDLMALPAALAKRHPHELSGGQQQRAGICRAMMLAPPVLLLDEPFSGIDPVNRRDIHQRLTILTRDQGTTVVLVTHDSREAIKLASHLVVLRQGRLIASGPQEAVLNQQDSYLKSLFEQTDD
jgi:osmoprotectant transport system ATP-binding protein